MSQMLRLQGIYSLTFELYNQLTSAIVSFLPLEDATECELQIHILLGNEQNYFVIRIFGASLFLLLLSVNFLINLSP